MNTSERTTLAQKIATWHWPGWAAAANVGWTLAVVGVLLALAIANISRRSSEREVEDGVLWATRPAGVTAVEIADGSPAAAAGIRAADVVLAVGGQPVERAAEVQAIIRAGKPGQALAYTLLRTGSRSAIDVPVKLAPIPQARNANLYYFMAAVGIFTLIVGTVVRLRRPGNAATLHFLWLSVAFFAVLAFSATGRFDRLDYVFYWANQVAVLFLPPLFLHFTLFFPERPASWAESRPGSAWPLVYLPALLLGAVRVAALARVSANQKVVVAVLNWLERIEPLYLSLCLAAGLVVVARAFRQVRSLTARRQLRWIAWGTALGALPFALGYAVPFALGRDPSLTLKLSVIPLSLIPLAFACALVRYRLADVEVIIKRAMVWAAALAATAAIYTAILKLASWVFLEDSHQQNFVIAVLATIVMVLLAKPLIAAIQATFDRAFYRDRYDYRRALVGFARDLSTDLDLYRLSDRIVSRVTETLLVDRMALLLAEERTAEFVAIRTAGLAGEAVRLSRASVLGSRVCAGQTVGFDDPVTRRGIPLEELEAWRERELYYFIPCVSKDATIAVLALGRKAHAEPLSSEDTALLLAVAAQAATALENGRLYRQLQLKAEELGRMREFNESILESLDVGLAVVDGDDRVVRWNRALETMFGLSSTEAAGRSLAELFDTAFVESIGSARRQAPQGASLYRLSLTPRASRPDGRMLVNVTTVPLRAFQRGAESAAGTVVIIDDVTARVQLEEQLQISDKMASIGLLAAGVAHEVNTPLTGISSFTQMLLEGADQDDPKTKLLEKIERQTFRAAKIVNGLLNLSRPSAGNERAPVDLNVVISDVLSLLDHQFKVARIQVRRDLASPGPVVMGIEHKLQQVFLNLFLNARDAMPKGGWLSIATRIVDGTAVAEVGDTGSGIPSEHLARIYDPFFTTKAIGQGTGLGLSITYGIVREHDGTIACDSEVGVGTRFTLSLPSAVATRSGRAV